MLCEDVMGVVMQMFVHLARDYLSIPVKLYGTEWPIMCWCAIKKLLTQLSCLRVPDPLLKKNISNQVFTRPV